MRNAQNFTPEERRKYVGASDLPAILGISQYQSALELAMLKRGELEPQPQNFAMTWGKKLEGIVADIVAEEHQMQLRRWEPPYIHNTIPFFRCHLDRIVKGNPNLAVEIKTTSNAVYRTWEEGPQGISPYVFSQVQGQFACKPNLQTILVAVGIRESGQVHSHWVQPDHNYIKNIETEVQFFWNQVVHGDQQPKQLTLADWKYFDLRESVVATEETLDVLRELNRCQQLRKEAESVEHSLKAQLATLMNSAEAITSTEGKTLCTFKPMATTKFDSKTFKTDHPELFANYSLSVENRVMRIMHRNLPSVQTFVSNETPESQTQVVN